MAHGNTDAGPLDWLFGDVDEAFHRSFDDEPGGGLWDGFWDAGFDLAFEHSSDDSYGRDTWDLPGPSVGDWLQAEGEERPWLVANMTLAFVILVVVTVVDWEVSL